MRHEATHSAALAQRGNSASALLVPAGSGVGADIDASCAGAAIQLVGESNRPASVCCLAEWSRPWMPRPVLAMLSSIGSGSAPGRTETPSVAKSTGGASRGLDEDAVIVYGTLRMAQLLDSFGCLRRERDHVRV